MIVIGVLAVLVAAVLLAAYFCYRMAFHAVRKEKPESDAIEIPEGEIYEVFRPEMERWAREVRALPREEMDIVAFDGTPLHGRFYEYKPGAPIELMFHGYRGSAKLFGGFDLEECSPVEAVKKAKKPVIFYHGESDAFVPYWMSEKMYDACASRKRLVTVPGAGHGLAFPVDQEGYLKAAREFFGPEASAEE